MLPPTTSRKVIWSARFSETFLLVLETVIRSLDRATLVIGRVRVDLHTPPPNSGTGRRHPLPPPFTLHPLKMTECPPLVPPHLLADFDAAALRIFETVTVGDGNLQCVPRPFQLCITL